MRIRAEHSSVLQPGVQPVITHRHFGRALAFAGVAVVLTTTPAGAGVSAGAGVITMRGAGQVVPLAQVDLNFQAPGQVASVDAVAGEHVAKGQALARLDGTLMQARLAQALADLNAARAALAGDPNNTAVDRALLARDRTTIESAQKALSDSRLLSKGQLQLSADAGSRAAARVVAAQSRLAALQEDLNTKTANHNTANSTLTTSQSTVGNDRTSVSSAETTLSGDTKTEARLQGELSEHNAALQSAESDLQQARDDSDSAAIASAKARVASEQAAITSRLSSLTSIGQTIVDDEARLQTASDQLGKDQASLADAEAAAAQATAAFDTATAAFMQQQSTLVDAQSADRTATLQAGVDSTQIAQTLSAAQSGLATAQTNKAVTQASAAANLQNARVRVAATRAALAGAQADLAATTLRAPQAGIVAAINGATGQTVLGSGSSTGNPFMIFISDLSHARLSFDEVDTAKLAVGERLSVEVAALDAESFPARVEAISLLPSSTQPSTAASSGNAQAPSSVAASTANGLSYDVLVAFDRSDPRMRAGMSAVGTVNVPASRG